MFTSKFLQVLYLYLDFEYLYLDLEYLYLVLNLSTCSNPSRGTWHFCSDLGVEYLYLDLSTLSRVC